MGHIHLTADFAESQRRNSHANPENLCKVALIVKTAFFTYYAYFLGGFKQQHKKGGPIFTESELISQLLIFRCLKCAADMFKKGLVRFVIGSENVMGKPRSVYDGGDVFFEH